MDITGPFPITNYAKKYAMVVMDNATSWPEASALSKTDSRTVAITSCKCLPGLTFISKFSLIMGPIL